MRHLDVLIRGGRVVDGTGGAAYSADVGIEGDRLVMAPTEAAAGEIIDARGKVVAPGFIDLHSHSGLMILADPRHEPKVRQGVTTEVIGVDGNSYAPFANRDDLLAFVELNGGLDGRPDLAFDWDTAASYLTGFDGQVAVNLCFLVGNSALRIAAVGWDDVPADEGALDRQRALLREAMEDGAFGLSSG